MDTPIISKQIRVRVPDHFNIGDGSVIDDFCYFSTQINIGKYCHIANGVSIAGGKEFVFTLGDFSAISAGVKMWCSSTDFTNDIACLMPPEISIKQNSIIGDISIGELTVIGANSVIMPNQAIPIGVAIGALSFVPDNFSFEPWYVYTGKPIRKLTPRNKTEVLRQRDALSAALHEKLLNK